MHSVEPKLADWHRLYKDLEQAQMRLQAEIARPSAASVRTHLQREVERLTNESDRSLDIIYAALPTARFVLLYGEWEMAEEQAIRAEEDLFRALKAYRAETDSPPSRGEIVEAKRLRRVARERLRDLKTYADGERSNAMVI